MREKQVTGSVQYFAIYECDCGKASMTSHEGKEFAGSVQFCAVNKCHCGKASMTGRVGKRGYRFSAVLHCQ